MSEPKGTTAPPPRARRTDRSPWYLLLLIPVALVVYPPLYNRDEPALGGMPFFYWYQLAVVPVSVLCTYIAYRQTRDPGGRR